MGSAAPSGRSHDPTREFLRSKRVSIRKAQRIADDEVFNRVKANSQKPASILRVRQVVNEFFAVWRSLTIDVRAFSSAVTVITWCEALMTAITASTLITVASLSTSQKR